MSRQLVEKTKDTLFPPGSVALVTGAAQRIGADIVRALHAEGLAIALHYRASAQAAEELASELEATRPDSVALLQADLLDPAAPRKLVGKIEQRWGQLDVLVNNASAFYPTPVGEIDAAHWDELMGSNVRAPLFLAQAAAPLLARARGAIVNLVDIHGMAPLRSHPVYSSAKAALIMLTRSLAIELAPDIRVNAVAPGAILPPTGTAALPEGMVEGIPLRRAGSPHDIAQTVVFLARPGSYVTGQVIAVDGGKSLLGERPTPV